MEISLSCGHPRQASQVSSFAYQDCHLPIWRGLFLSWVYTCPCVWGLGSHCTQKAPKEVLKQHFPNKTLAMPTVPQSLLLRLPD